MRRSGTTTRSVAGATLLVLSIWLAGSARAHEEGVLTLASPTVAAGGVLSVGGERFSADTEYRLLLKGALREFELGVARADSAGAFRLRLDIPPSASPGSYRLVAVAPDGDDVAEVDVQLVAMAAAPSHSDTESEAPHAASVTASAEDLIIERRWSGFEWFVIGALFGGGLAAGAFLYRRPRAA